MNTLQEIQSLLLPIWNKIYDKPECPKSFIKLMTYIIPKYKDSNFDGLLGKLKKKGVVSALKKTQIDFIELGLLDKTIQKGFGELIDIFEETKVNYSNLIENAPDLGIWGPTASGKAGSIKGDKDLMEFLNIRLRNKIVVDLGAGQIDDSVMGVCKLLSELGVKKYFAVDKYEWGDGGDATLKDLKRSEKEVEEHMKKTPPKIKLINEDMLQFLRSLPKNYCSVIIWNIDNHIIKQGEYREQLRKEIIRVIPKQGILITDRDFDEFENLPEEGFKFVKKIHLDEVLIFEKISY